MAFASMDFIFDGVVGSMYGLYLMELGSSSSDEVDLGANYEIITDSTNLSGNYMFGMINSKPLQFPISIMSTEPIDRVTNSMIARWLFNQRQYKRLQILDDTIQGTYYLCKINNPKLVKVGNQIYGYRADVICDCPYAHQFPTKLTRTKTTTDLIVPINNMSDDNNIVYPTIKLYPNKANGTVSISNSANDNVCTITSLISGEVITLYSKHKIIKSDRVQLNFDRFNGEFVELNPLLNRLTVSGDVSKIEIEYEFLRSVGG